MFSFQRRRRGVMHGSKQDSRKQHKRVRVRRAKWGCPVDTINNPGLFDDHSRAVRPPFYYLPGAKILRQHVVYFSMPEFRQLLFLKFLVQHSNKQSTFIDLPRVSADLIPSKSPFYVEI